jgi:hypothetical protein
MNDINDPAKFGIHDGYRVREYPITKGGPFISGYQHLCDACSHEHRSGQPSRHNTAPGSTCESPRHESNVLLANSGAEEPSEYEQHRNHPEVLGWLGNEFKAGEHTLCPSCAEDKYSSGGSMGDYTPIHQRFVMADDQCRDCGHLLISGRKEAAKHRAISDAEFQSLTNLPPLDLERQGLGRCSRCGAPLAPGEQGLCPNCQNDGGARKHRQRQKLVRTQNGTERSAMKKQSAYYGEDGQYPQPGHIVRSEPGWRGHPNDFHASGDPDCSHQQPSEWNPSPDDECHGHHNPPHPLQAAIEKHKNYKGTRTHVPIMNNTWIHQDTEGAYHIRHHSTDIISVTPNGDVTINPDGWHSPTTMKRMHQFLPSGVDMRRNPSRARNAPDRLLTLPNGEKHPYHDGISFNVHTHELLPDDHVRPGTPLRPPQARGTGDEPPRRSPRRNRDYSEPSRYTPPSFGEGYSSEPGEGYDPGRDRAQLEHADSHIPHDTSHYDQHYWTPPSGDHDSDLPGENESFEDWINRTTTAPKFDKCNTCRGKGKVRSGEGASYERKDCDSCKGSGYVRGDGSPANVDNMGRLSKRQGRPISLDALHEQYVGGLRLLALREIEAYGETKAPVAVDTLRDENCPVCGEHDSYDGDQCQICGFVTPPKMFRDPDLDAAKLLDLRSNPANGEANDTNPALPPVDPTAVDAEGEVMPGAEGEEAAEVQDDDDNEEGVVNVETRGLGDDDGQVVDPNAVDEEGNVVTGPEDPDAANTHFNQGGEPFTKGPNAPVPGEPAEPMEAEDGQMEDEETQGVPGVPGDGAADLLCPSCGFEADAAHPTSTPGSVTEPADAGDGMLGGDVCPNCQKATLMSVGEVQEMEQMMTGAPAR